MSASLTMQRALEDARNGRLPQALATIRSLAQRKPKDLAVAQVFGALLHQAGEFEQARHQFARTVAAAPNDAGNRSNLATVLLQLERLPEAAQQLERALELDAQYVAAYLGLTACRLRMNDARAAITAAQRGLALQPHWPELVCALMLAHEAVLEIDLAIDLGLATLKHHPMHPQLWSQTLMMLNYTERADAEINGWHRRFGFTYERPIDPIGFDRDPARPLRIAFLSPDLRTHSVAYFAQALLRCAPSDVHTIALSTETTPQDPMTQTLKAMTAEWHDVGALDDAALDGFIRQQKVDVLVELAGHSGANRVTALVNKPAPLIVSALGYPNTTGLAAVDLRLCDAITDPLGHEQQMVERPLRIAPCFLCFTPPIDAPTPALPAAGAPITFGSFNALSKISATTAALWARVLAAVPGSRLLLKAKTLKDPGSRVALLAQLHAAGIAPDCIELLPATATLHEHLALYQRLHIALDTYPYHGTTTTCEALWMGVPVVSLLGQCHAARVGASLLNAVGHTELIAKDSDAFVQICAQLAADRTALTALRDSLRAEMQAGALLDAPKYATGFYAAIRTAWQQRCLAP